MSNAPPIGPGTPLPGGPPVNADVPTQEPKPVEDEDETE